MYLVKIVIKDHHDYSSVTTVTSIITSLCRKEFLKEFEGQLIIAKQYVDDTGDGFSSKRPIYSDIFYDNLVYRNPSIKYILKHVRFIKIVDGMVDHSQYGHWE